MTRVTIATLQIITRLNLTAAAQFYDLELLEMIKLAQNKKKKLNYFFNHNKEVSNEAIFAIFTLQSKSVHNSDQLMKFET